MGRLPGTSLYRNIKQYPNAERYDGLVIVRIDAPLYFANAQNARDKVRKYKRVADEELARRHTGTKVRYIIIDLSPVSHMDTTALHVLQDMHQTQTKLGVQLCFCNPNITITLRLLKSGLLDLVGRDHFFSDVIDAVQWCLNEMDNSPSCRRLENTEGFPNGEVCV
uniref:STAS domain-containing protein n=1 Tax=Amphora coffeiformis TaxID=265554 RepID=A0A7S3PAU5_9STRA